MNRKNIKLVEHIFDNSIKNLQKIHEAREAGLSTARKIISISSKAIRAAHRNELRKSEQLIDEAISELKVIKPTLKKSSYDLNSTFLLDAEKEICEAIIFLSFISGKSISKSKIKGFSPSALLKGMAEATSELRRTSLDRIRSDSVHLADHHLLIMNEIVDLLESVDFPEGVTGGLRRSTDQLRSVVERTRGDITIALERKELESKIDSLRIDLEARE